MKGSSSVTVKAVNTTTSASNKGQKRKNDLTQQDQDGSYENPPAKRGKALPAAEQQTHPVPCPMQKNTKHLEDPDKWHNTKKRPSEAADMLIRTIQEHLFCQKRQRSG